MVVFVAAAVGVGYVGHADLRTLDAAMGDPVDLDNATKLPGS